MSVFDFIKGELLEIIEWTDDSRDTLSYRFPDDDKAIKNGAQLIVRESQLVQFVYLGEFGDTFAPGKHSLTTDNIPILTRLKSWKYGFNSPFKADVYDLTTRLSRRTSGAPPTPSCCATTTSASSGRARWHLRLQDHRPEAVPQGSCRLNHNFRLDEFAETMRSRVVSIFSDALASAKIPVLDVASRYTELGEALLPLINPVISSKYGIQLGSFIVENVSVPPEVEAAIDKKSSMAAIGNLNDFVKYQMAKGMEQPGGGGAAGTASELAVGFAIAQQIMQQHNMGNLQVPGAAPAAAAGAAAAAAAPGLPELLARRRRQGHRCARSRRADDHRVRRARREEDREQLPGDSLSSREVSSELNARIADCGLRIADWNHPRNLTSICNRQSAICNSTVMPSITALSKFPCPACGAQAEWNPGKSKLVCPFCGTESPYQIDRVTGQIQELDLVKTLRELPEDQRGWQAEKRSVQCQSCRAVMVFDPTRVGQNCESAARRRWWTTRRSRRPFARKACCRSRWRRPRCANRFADGMPASGWRPAGSSRGRWSIRCTASTCRTGRLTPMSCARGEPRRGTTTTRTRPTATTRAARRHARRGTCVGRTRRAPSRTSSTTSRCRGRKAYGTTYSGRSSRSRRPDLVPYDAAMLSGFVVEHYQIVLLDAAERSVQQMRAALEALCAQQVPGDTYRNLEISPTFSDRTFKHVLLPVWLLTYTFGARPIRCW